MTKDKPNCNHLWIVVSWSVIKYGDHNYQETSLEAEVYRCSKCLEYLEE